MLFKTKKEKKDKTVCSLVIRGNEYQNTFLRNGPQPRTPIMARGGSTTSHKVGGGVKKG